MLRFEALARQAAEIAAADPKYEILSKSPSSVRVENRSDGRVTAFRAVPYTRAAMNRKLRIASGVAQRCMHHEIRMALSEWLMQLDPEVVLCLDEICLASFADDVEALARELKISTDDFPDGMRPDDFDLKVLSGRIRGRNSVVLNPDAIRIEIFEKYLTLGPSTGQAIERRLWEELLYQLRLCMFETPFPQPWLDGLGKSDTEARIWAENIYETLHDGVPDGHVLVKYGLASPAGDIYGLFQGLNLVGLPEREVVTLIRPMNTYMPFCCGKTYDDKPVYWFTAHGVEAFEADIKSIAERLAPEGWRVAKTSCILDKSKYPVYYQDRFQVLTAQRPDSTAWTLI